MKKIVRQTVGRQLFIAIGLAFCLCLCAIVRADDGPKDFSSAREFVGVVTPEAIIDIPYGFHDEFRGVISYAATPGEIFQGSILDEAGNVIKKGDALIKMFPGYSGLKLKEAQADLEEANILMAIAEKDFKRSEQLKSKNLVSAHDYQHSKAAYYLTKAAVAKAETEVLRRKKIHDMCVYYATFDGVINKVYLSSGLTAGGEPNIINVSQLNPINVLVKMDRRLANQISSSTPVTIYPMPSVSDNPIGIIIGASRLTDDGIEFESGNYLLNPKVKIDGKVLPVVHKLHHIFKPDGAKSLCVNSVSLKKDEKGYYLYKAVGQKSLTPGSSIANVFPIKKIYVKLNNVMLWLAPDNKMEELADNPDITPCDVMVEDIPDGVSDGDKVYYCDSRYLLMPGDSVRVVIGPSATDVEI